MKERIRQQLRDLDIRIVGWVDQWDPLAAQWIFESFVEYESSELNDAIVLDWFRSLKNDPMSTFYAVTSKGNPVGVGAIMAQNPILRSAECHLFLDESMTNRGVAHLIAGNTFRTLFDNGFETLMISPMKNNVLAINTAKKLGFEESRDIVSMKLTKDNWLKKSTYVAARKDNDDAQGESYGRIR